MSHQLLEEIGTLDKVFQNLNPLTFPQYSVWKSSERLFEAGMLENSNLSPSPGDSDDVFLKKLFNACTTNLLVLMNVLFSPDLARTTLVNLVSSLCIRTRHSFNSLFMMRDKTCIGLKSNMAEMSAVDVSRRMNTDEWKFKKYRKYGVNGLFYEHVGKVHSFLFWNNDSCCLKSTSDFVLAYANSASWCVLGKHLWHAAFVWLPRLILRKCSFSGISAT